MFFAEQPVNVWRKALPIGTTWGDPVKTIVATYYFGIQAFTGDDTFANDQSFSNVRDVLIHTNTELDIKDDDELEYNNSIHYIAYIVPCRSGVLPHLEIFTSNTQTST